ncbi:MAG: GGDEF domain-containing protein, partial [Dehalococcoidia bacterium]|nr:GGDEF domain-containing protein [Dehalococcoidia bacterium]
YPERFRAIQPAIPFVTTGIIFITMLTLPPEVAPFGLSYLVLAGVFSHVVLTPRSANLLTGCAIGALVAWSAIEGRPLLADALLGTSVLIVGAAAARHVGSARRDALAQAVHARRDAEELSLRDPLTNLPNRRAFDAEADLRVLEGRLGGVILVDVDHFKTVNDQYGHPAGDEVLAEVARRLAGALRRADLPARLGGDEFAVLIEGPLTLEGLRRVADAVRGATSAFAADTQAGYVKITTSVGGALVPLDVPEGRRVRAVRTLADRALYQAKKAGRDRAIIEGERNAPSARRGRRRPRPGGSRAA